jgi:hypothetical protein
LTVILPGDIECLSGHHVSRSDGVRDLYWRKTKRDVNILDMGKSAHIQRTKTLAKAEAERVRMTKADDESIVDSDLRGLLRSECVVKRT